MCGSKLFISHVLFQSVVEVKAKLWLEHDSKFIMGKGRAELLSQIDKTGSIAEAARFMNMSYSHAWSEVREISRAVGKPVVQTFRGGTKGGGASLTVTGKELLIKFNKEMESLDRHLANGY